MSYEINDPRAWRVSKSGYSIKTGWDMADQRTIANYPGAYLPGPLDSKRFQQWLDDAELICEQHNAALSQPQQGAVALSWLDNVLERMKGQLQSSDAAFDWKIVRDYHSDLCRVRSGLTAPTIGQQAVDDAAIEIACRAFYGERWLRMDNKDSPRSWMRAALTAALAAHGKGG